MFGGLKIIGAAYGPKDVTGLVRKLRQGRELSIDVNNTTFGGDPWPGHQKTLVVVYRYDNSFSSVETMIVREGNPLKISSTHHSHYLKEDRLDTKHLKEIQQVSRHSTAIGTTKPLDILGAAYGTSDVTKLARDYLTNGEFDKYAKNGVWEGDNWTGHKKTLVVVYEYDGAQMLSVVKEDERMYFVASPPLIILSAAYGLFDVTKTVRSHVKNRSLTMEASNDIFGNGWPKVSKSFTVFYQYGEEVPKLKSVKQGEELEILYSKGRNTDPYLTSLDPDDLVILGASYGPRDVTQQVRSLVLGDNLHITVTNGVLGGNPWPKEEKSLAVVYRTGCSPPRMKIAKQDDEMTIKVAHPPYEGDLVNIDKFLENDTVIALSAFNGQYVSCDGSNDKLVALKAAPDAMCAMTVKTNHPKVFKLLCANGKYVEVRQHIDSTLFATASKEKATLFYVSLSAKGGLRLATVVGMYVSFDSSDNSLRATSTSHFGAGTMFGVALQQTSQKDKHSSEKSPDDLTHCELAWASFSYQLVGGFFLAVGLIPFITTDTVHIGLWGLIESSPEALEALQGLAHEIVNVTPTGAAIIGAMLSVIKVLYEEGILWQAFKMMLKVIKVPVEWFAVTWVLSKIVEFGYPEAGVAAVLAGSTVWAVKVTKAGLEVGRACNKV